MRRSADAPAAAPPAAADMAVPPAPPAAPPTALRLREPSDRSDNAAVRDEPSAAGAMSRGTARATPTVPLQRDDTTVGRPAALTALLASVAAEPERWSWQRSETRRPMTPALQRWLAQFERATATRWRAAADPAPSAGADLLLLYRDGTPAATLRLGDDAVWLAPGSQASLPRAALATLKQALDDAAP